MRAGIAASFFAPRVLVVENDPDLSKLLQALLTEEGYVVVCASSLSQALVLTQDQVFNGIFTMLFAQGTQDPLLSVELLRVQTQPTPIVVLSRSFVVEAEARWRGYAGVLEFPFRIEDVLQACATHITRPFSAERVQQAHVITQYLDAMGQEEWEIVRRLCLPSVKYVPLTPSLFTPAPVLEGIDAYLAYAQAARIQFPDYHQEHRAVFEQRSGLITHFSTSWQGSEGQRLSMRGAVVCRFAGERIAQIGVALNQRRLRALLEHTALG